MLIRTLLMSAIFFSQWQATADDLTARTGKECKEHLQGAQMSQSIYDLLTAFTFKNDQGQKIGSPTEVPLQNFDLQTGMDLKTRAYILRVRQVLNECETFCKGLTDINGKIFTCDGLRKSTAKSVQLLLDRDMISDGAIYYVAPIDDSLFEGESGSEPANTQTITNGFKSSIHQPHHYVRKVMEATY